MKQITDQEWQTILAENPTNDDLRYCIEYTSKQNEAGKLLKLRPQTKKMIDIIAASQADILSDD